MTPEIVLVATKNKNKLDEIRSILTDPSIHFKSLSEFEDVPDVAETGKTFRANALIKARFYFKYSALPVIADDSGLVVPALGDEPGIFSARYAGEKSSYTENNRKLLHQMRRLEGDLRKAHFICQIAYLDKNTCLTALGRVDGVIIKEQRGRSGFGYDPLFYVEKQGKTFAELRPEEKNRISHRYRALKNLSRKLSGYWANRT
jgi:XTP/dITP diphosphohydrolase